MTSGRRSTLAQCALFIVCLLLVAWRASTPRWRSRSACRAARRRRSFGRFTGWILDKQAEFYRMLSGAIRAAKADGSAAWALMGISFAYGIFHAAGPGHGKAVISSYLVANDETWRRGIALSFASAILQAFTAIAIVGIAAVLLGATAHVMGNAVRVDRDGELRADHPDRPAAVMGEGPRLPASAAAAARMSITITPMTIDHARSRPRRMITATRHDHAHDHDHDDEAHAWGHAHAPEPSELKGPHWLRRGLSAIVAVGLRPCSGAIIVLVFALAQGLFWIGVASTFVMGLGTAITVAASPRSRSPRAALPGGWPRASPAPACCSCAAWRPRRRC